MKQHASFFATLSLGLCLVVVSIAPACAQTSPQTPQQGPQSQQGKPPAPPPEAYAACKGKTEGATVSMTMPDGKQLSGTCRTINGALAAAPVGGPPPSR